MKHVESRMKKKKKIRDGRVGLWWSGVVVVAVVLSGCGGGGASEDVPERLRHMRDSATFADLPRNPEQLAFGYGSAEELVDTLLLALERRDTTRLVDLAISPEEWREILYPELGLHFPDARDERPEILETLGELHFGSSLKGLHRMVRDFGGEKMERVELETAAPPLRFPSYAIHEKPRLVVSNPGGRERRVTFLGSIVEKEGIFKLLAYREAEDG